MPQIKEYTQQTSAPGVFNSAQMSPEAGQAEGRANQQMGAVVGNLGEIVQKRNEMNEISNANVAMSELQAKYTNRLHQEANEGTFNSDKFLQDYQDETDKASENFSTVGAQDFIKKTSIGTKQHLSTSGFAVSAELASVKAKQDMAASESASGQSIYRDPSQLELTLQKDNLYLDSFTNKNKGLAKAVEVKKQEIKAKYAMQAVKGSAQINVDKAESDLNAGKWDSYLNGEQLDEMRRYMDTTRNGQLAKANLAEKQIEKAKKQRSDEFANKTFADIHHGTFDAESVINNDDMSWETKARMFALVRTDGKEVKKSQADTKVMQTRMKIDSYEITESSVLDEMVLNKEITVKQRDGLFKHMTNPLTTEGQQMKTAKISLNNQAKSLISDGTGGIPQADGPRRMQDFFTELDSFVTEKRKAGISLHEIYDSKKSNGEYSKNSAYNLIQKHRATLNDNVKGLVEKINSGQSPVTKPKMSPAEFLKQKSDQ